MIKDVRALVLKRLDNSAFMYQSGEAMKNGRLKYNATNRQTNIKKMMGDEKIYCQLC